MGVCGVVSPTYHASVVCDDAARVGIQVLLCLLAAAALDHLELAIVLLLCAGFFLNVLALSGGQFLFVEQVLLDELYTGESRVAR